MGKLNGNQREALLEALMGGTRSSDIQKQFGVSKTTVTSYKRDLQKEKQVKSNAAEPDKEEIIEQPKQTGIDAYYDPENVKSFAEEEEVAEMNEKHTKIPKSLLNQASKKLKSEEPKSKKGKKETVRIDNEEPVVEVVDEDIEKLKLKIRQYSFAFESDVRVKEYIGNDINKFNLGLAKKSYTELDRILTYIKFLIKSNSNTDKIIETGLMTTMMLVEKIGTRVGLQFDGLTKEIGDELKDETSDLKRTILEIGIEMDVSKYFQNPKVDLLLSISKKMLFTHSKNKALNQLKPSANNMPPPQPIQNVATFLKSGLDEGLKDKYQDL